MPAMDRTNCPTTALNQLMCRFNGRTASTLESDYVPGWRAEISRCQPPADELWEIPPHTSCSFLSAERWPMVRLLDLGSAWVGTRITFPDITPANRSNRLREPRAQHLQDANHLSLQLPASRYLFRQDATSSGLEWAINTRWDLNNASLKLCPEVIGSHSSCTCGVQIPISIAGKAPWGSSVPLPWVKLTFTGTLGITEFLCWDSAQIIMLCGVGTYLTRISATWGPARSYGRRLLGLHLIPSAIHSSLTFQHLQVSPPSSLHLAGELCFTNSCWVDHWHDLIA